jgi:hypothetical protein
MTIKQQKKVFSSTQDPFLLQKLIKLNLTLHCKNNNQKNATDIFLIDIGLKLKIVPDSSEWISF